MSTTNVQSSNDGMCPKQTQEFKNISYPKASTGIPLYGNNKHFREQSQQTTCMQI